MERKVLESKEGSETSDKHYSVNGPHFPESGGTFYGGL